MQATQTDVEFAKDELIVAYKWQTRLKTSYSWNLPILLNMFKDLLTQYWQLYKKMAELIQEIFVNIVFVNLCVDFIYIIECE